MAAAMLRNNDAHEKHFPRTSTGKCVLLHHSHSRAYSKCQMDISRELKSFLALRKIQVLAENALMMLNTPLLESPDQRYPDYNKQRQNHPNAPATAVGRKAGSLVILAEILGGIPYYRVHLPIISTLGWPAGTIERSADGDSSFAAVEDAFEGGLAGEGVGFGVHTVIAGVSEYCGGEGVGDAFPAPASKFSDIMPGAFFVWDDFICVFLVAGAMTDLDHLSPGYIEQLMWLRPSFNSSWLPPERSDGNLVFGDHFDEVCDKTSPHRG
jgi:hypothetical protein